MFGLNEKPLENMKSYNISTLQKQSADQSSNASTTSSDNTSCGGDILSDSPVLLSSIGYEQSGEQCSQLECHTEKELVS